MEACNNNNAPTHFRVIDAYWSNHHIHPLPVGNPLIARCIHVHVSLIINMKNLPHPQ